MAFFIQLTINGLMLGGLYAAMTLGFSVIWGVMGLINLAHGEFIMLGAYIAWLLAHPTRTEIGISVGGHQFSVFSLMLLASWAALGLILSHFALRRVIKQPIMRRVAGYGGAAIVVAIANGLWLHAGYPPVDPLLSIPVVMLIIFGFGYVLQRGLLNRLIDGQALVTLLVTFGISAILSNVVLRIFSPNPLSITVAYAKGLPLFGSVTIPPINLIVSVLSLVMMGGLSVFLRYTDTGRAIRAAAQNKMAARLVGINVKETYAITFALCVAIAAAAGAMYSSLTAIVPTLGEPLTLRAFAITALGGLGKVEGAVVGGIVLGLAESYVGGYVNTGWAVTVAFVLLVVFLVVRPQGLLGGLKATSESL